MKGDSSSRSEHELHQIRNEMPLYAHELPEFFDFATTDGHFGFQIAQTKQIRIVKPRHDLTNLDKIHEVGTMATEEGILRQATVKIGNADRHRELSIFGIHLSDLLLSLRIIDVRRIGDNDIVIAQQIDPCSCQMIRRL